MGKVSHPSWYVARWIHPDNPLSVFFVGPGVYLSDARPFVAGSITGPFISKEAAMLVALGKETARAANVQHLFMDPKRRAKLHAEYTRVTGWEVDEIPLFELDHWMRRR